MAKKQSTTTKKAPKPATRSAKAKASKQPKAAAKNASPKATAKAGAKKQAPAKKAAGGKPAKKLSQMGAALRVLAEAREPMHCRAMVETMQAKGYWTSPGGKTPEATLYASILRDIRKGKDARFKKTDRGAFALAGGK